jgi:hypothetical protein
MTYNGAHIVLVLAAAAMMDTFQEQFLKECQERRIARLVIKRIDSISTPTPDNPILNVYQRLREDQVSYVGFSTALPLDTMVRVMKKMHFVHGNTLLI